jgi:hypothetical protein
MGSSERAIHLVAAVLLASSLVIGAVCVPLITGSVKRNRFYGKQGAFRRW